MREGVDEIGEEETKKGIKSEEQKETEQCEGVRRTERNRVV